MTRHHILKVAMFLSGFHELLWARFAGRQIRALNRGAWEICDYERKMI